MFTRIVWPTASTVQNIKVNVLRKSMRTIVLFFKDDNVDNEVYPNPYISKVKLEIRVRNKLSPTLPLYLSKIQVKLIIFQN